MSDTRSIGSMDELVAGAFTEHWSAILGAATRSTRDPEVAEDVTQEAFLRLLGEARAGRYPDNVRAWLYRASANLIISRARHAAVARRVDPSLAPVHGPARPDDVAELRERHQALDSALSGLSLADRTALVLAAHGATGEELARRLGRSHAATRTLLSRARQRIRATAFEAAY